MAAMGAWLRRNGEAIYGTRPWIRAVEPMVPVRYTQSADAVFIHALRPATGELALPAELAADTATWLGAGDAEMRRDADGRVRASVPEGLRGDAVAVLAVPR